MSRKMVGVVRYLISYLLNSICTAMFDLPPKEVTNLKLELCHFLFLNANMLVALEDGNLMNYVA